MKRLSTFVALVAGLGLAAPVAAQQQGADQRSVELREMVSQGSTLESNRRVVREFLGSSEVTDVARSHELDVDAARARVATLDDASLADLAARIRTAQESPAQVGGDTFVISSTAVIIALLVIILVVVA